MAEVSLLTDRDQAIPVQVVRNGLRAVAYGMPGGSDGGTMEIRFLATNADVRPGDALVTSGIDGIYLPGLPVATVLRIEREAGYAFAKIVCKPAAGIDRFGQVLVLTGDKVVQPKLPAEVEEKPARSKRKKMRAENPTKEPAAAVEGRPNGAPAAAAPGPGSSPVPAGPPAKK